ncbi:MAG: exodeoxyribonuclease VII small subunit [Planctomycetota bacterium]
MPKKKEDSKESYEVVFQKLENLVRELESGDLPLDKSLQKFEEAVSALKKCHEILDNAQKKIEILTKDSLGNVIGREEFMEDLEEE